MHVGLSIATLFMHNAPVFFDTITFVTVHEFAWLFQKLACLCS